MRAKYTGVGFPYAFIENVIRDFQKPEEKMIIPRGFFDHRTELRVRIPYCPQNEKVSQKFVEKLCRYTGGEHKVIMIWLTRKIKTLFSLKDKLEGQTCMIYEGVCKLWRELYRGDQNTSHSSLEGT